jgi:CP family cyanate transporter-like MFS transporter
VTRQTEDSQSGPVWLLVVAVVLLAVNLRAAVNVIGPLLPAIRDELNLSGAGAGALTALPTFCCAAVGALGPLVARRVGRVRTIVVMALVSSSEPSFEVCCPSSPAPPWRLRPLLSRMS